MEWWPKLIQPRLLVRYTCKQSSIEQVLCIAIVINNQCSTIKPRQTRTLDNEIKCPVMLSISSASHSSTLVHLPQYNHNTVRKATVEPWFCHKWTMVPPWWLNHGSTMVGSVMKIWWFRQRKGHCKYMKTRVKVDLYFICLHLWFIKEWHMTHSHTSLRYKYKCISKYLHFTVMITVKIQKSNHINPN